MIVTVTNNGDTPRGVYTVGGVAFIQPGQSRELDIVGAELANARTTAGLVVVEPANSTTNVVEPVVSSISSKKKAA